MTTTPDGLPSYDRLADATRSDAAGAEAVLDRPRRKAQPMELLDFLAIAKQRIWILVGVPVAAAVLAIGYVLLSPTVWTNVATVSAPALVGGQFGNQYTGSQAVNQFVAQFQAVATGPMIINQTSEKTKIAADRIRDGLTVAQVGASSVMTVQFSDTNAGSVNPVITEISTRTLNELFGAQVGLASQLVKTSTAGLDKADAAISVWEVKNNIVSPDDVYRTKLSQVANLEQQQVSLQASGNTAGVASAKAQVAAIQTDLKRFGPLLAQYHALTAGRDAATTSIADAQKQLQSAVAQQAAADPAKVVYVGTVRDAGKSSELISLVAPVIAAGIFLGVLLVVMLEMLAASRRRAADAAYEADANS